MATMHMFVSTGRFRSFEEMRRFIDETYTDDGDGIPSAFMQEVGLSGYERGCIEVLHSEAPIDVTELLSEASYSNEWQPRVSSSRVADSAICVFEPNTLRHPRGCSLDYLGAFEYEP